jgi:hypothetical protein
MPPGRRRAFISRPFVERSARHVPFFVNSKWRTAPVAGANHLIAVAEADDYCLS